MLYILLGTLLGVLIYFKIIKPAKYWQDRNVINEPAWPIVGNMGKTVLKKKHIMDINSELYNKYSNERYVGLMQFVQPALLIRDLELIKQITVKEFDHFHDHLGFGKSDNDPLLSKSLSTLTGNEWRQMRPTLSPVFTSSKMRAMYQLMVQCAENFVGHFRGKEQVAVEMKDVLSRFTTDVIATTAFGINVDSLNEPNNNFFTMSRRLTQFGILQFVRLMLVSKSEFLGKIFGSGFVPRDITDFFRFIIKDSINKREKNGIVRLDLIHLLMEARKGRLKHEGVKDSKDEGFATVEESHIGKNTNHMKLTDDDIVAQAMLFFFAGFDTVSTASSFLAYELAINPGVQEKLQQEIDQVNQKCNGKIPYETILSMKYLDQVVSESLRMWPPAFQTDRLCTKDYTIEPKNSTERKVTIEKGAVIFIPIMALHRDPQYYPEPTKFDPERFNDENKPKIVPGSYMPFGAGPRNCIGSRFALLEIKTLFFHLLSKFDIIPLNQTEIPIKISPKKVNLAPENGFRLAFRPRKI